jgi:sugar phosphate isomerase/epimerase
MLTFMSGCLAARSFRDHAEAAGRAGFEAITIWPNVLRRALRKDGLSPADMRALLDDNGLVLAEIEGCVDWAPGMEHLDNYGIKRKDYLDLTAALGGRNVGAIFPLDATLDLARAANGFAELCDDAAARGLGVALEFVSFGAVADAATAWAIVEQAGRPSGGLVVDLFHHARGPAQGDNAMLRTLPASAIRTVQLCDLPKHATPPLREETMRHRLLPGEGELDVAGFVQTLREMGVDACFGIEVYRPDFEQRSTEDVMAILIHATKRALSGGDERSA